MKSKRFMRPLFTGTAVAGLVIGLGGAYALANGVVTPVTGIDHERIVVTLAPGGSYTFVLPRANDPVRIDLDEVSTNGGVQTPSEVFSALVNANANNAGMSWIGTDSNGAQTGSSTIAGKDITNLVCGASCIIAELEVASVPAKTLVLEANKATSIINETYVINIWF
jgi:hypothetical protein